MEDENEILNKMNNLKISMPCNANPALCPGTVDKIGYYKFSLRKPRSRTISPSPTCIYYPFAANNRKFMRISFLTTWMPPHTVKEAKSLLSLTYTPKWYSTCIPQSGAKIEITFKDSPRVWPAFGNKGGAMEYLLCRGTSHLEHTERLHIPNAGQKDYFAQRSVQAQELFLMPTWRLDNDILSKIRNAVVPEKLRESPGGIMFDLMRGILVATSISPDERIYGSVSISIHKPLGKTRLALMKFHGAIWQDEILPRNSIFGPFEQRHVVFSEIRWLPVTLKLKSGREAIDKHSKIEFKKILDRSWNELRDLAAKFKQLCGYPIELPLSPYDIIRGAIELEERGNVQKHNKAPCSARKHFAGSTDPDYPSKADK